MDPAEISLAISKPAEKVVQHVCLAHDAQKNAALKFIIDRHPDYSSILIFTSAKSKVHEIVRDLRKSGYASRGISSDLDQDQREEVLMGFWNGGELSLHDHQTFAALPVEDYAVWHILPSRYHLIGWRSECMA